MNRGTCRSCRLQVLWAVSAARGTAMPLEEDAEAGNIVVTADGRAHAFRSHAAAQAVIDDEEAARLLGVEDADRSGTYVSHHVRCPAGESWKGRHRQSEGQGSLL